MVQLWVNLPAKYKMTPPKYQEITHAMMGKYVLPDNNGVVEVIAGEYKIPGGSGQSVKGPAFTFTPLHLYNVRLKKEAKVEMSFPETYNTGILVVEGAATINEVNVPTDHFVLFKNDGEQITLETKEDAIILVLSGEPIDEPIAQYGPFLMNKWEEIEQAINDVNTGKFGVLEE